MSDAVDTGKKDDAAQALRDAGQKKSRASRTLGMQFVKADPDAGTAEVYFDASEEFMNPIGSIQGGFVGAMLDDVMSVVLSTTVGAGYGFPTLEMKVSFIGAAQPGKINATAKIVHRGRSTAFIEAELRDQEGKLIATSSCTSRIIPMKPR